jgi:3-oxo-5-alpha-steroid 4-dehydrogenase 1
MSELAFHRGLAWGMIGVAAATMLALSWVVAPYGRHTRAGWGPTVPARLGWIVMESPAVIAFIAIYALGAHAFELLPLAFLCLWQVHYVHRAFVMPLATRSGDRRTPILVVVMAIVFNLVNAYLNARQVSHLGNYSPEWWYDARFLAGAFLFLVGRDLNVRADRALVALRNQGAGYRIPTGPLFGRVSCPNYLGEIIEWTGWAIATWSLAGAAFALFTLANLAPRAMSHHRWYRAEFPDYPPSRRALIPWLW